MGLQLAGASGVLRTFPANAEALRAAEAARQIFEELAAEVPSETSYFAGLSDAWHEVGSCLWRFDYYEKVLHARRKALDIMNRISEKEPQNEAYRSRLDDRHIKLERSLAQMGHREEIMESLLAREKLWPGNAERLKVVAADL